MPTRTIVTGTGRYVPPRVVTNQDLEKLMDTTDQWIPRAERHRRAPPRRRRGRHLRPGRRGRRRLAIADAGIDPATIDLVVAATLSPDHYFPGIGVLVQAKLGLGTTAAIDIRNQCSGFFYALSVADQYVRTGAAKWVLLVASEVQSTNLDFSDRGRDM